MLAVAPAKPDGSPVGGDVPAPAPLAPGPPAEPAPEPEPVATADGFDVAITARTIHEGTATAGGRRLPGSLDTTAAEIEDHGRRAVPIALDLLEVDRLGGADLLTGLAFALLEIDAVFPVDHRPCRHGLGEGNVDGGPVLQAPVELGGDLLRRGGDGNREIGLAIVGIRPVKGRYLSIE